MEQFVRSSLQLAQIAVDGGLRGAQLGGDLADGTLHIKNARVVQRLHNADLFLHRQPVGRQPGAAGHLGNGILHGVGQGTDKVLHPDAGGGGLGVRPAEGKQLLRDAAVLAGIKQVIVTPNAPAAIGPYSQGIAAGQTVYVSGQLPIDPATGLIPEGIAAQTAQSLKNIQAILAQQEMTLANVVKTTVFLADINDFAEMNKVYGEYFAQPYPARSAVQVGKLPKDAPLEIECIAVK